MPAPVSGASVPVRLLKMIDGGDVDDEIVAVSDLGNRPDLRRYQDGLTICPRWSAPAWSRFSRSTRSFYQCGGRLLEMKGYEGVSTAMDVLKSRTEQDQDD